MEVVYLTIDFLVFSVGILRIDPELIQAIYKIKSTIGRLRTP